MHRFFWVRVIQFTSYSASKTSKGQSKCLLQNILTVEPSFKINKESKLANKKWVGWVRPTLKSELRPTFGSEVRQTPFMLLRSKLFLLSPAPHPFQS